MKLKKGKLMRNLLALLAMTAVLGACANTSYMKADSTPAQAEADRQACMQQGEIAVASFNSDNPFEIGMRKLTIADNCMRLKGYAPSAG